MAIADSGKNILLAQYDTLRLARGARRMQEDCRVLGLRSVQKFIAAARILVETVQADFDQVIP